MVDLKRGGEFWKWKGGGKWRNEWEGMVKWKEFGWDNEE